MLKKLSSSTPATPGSSWVSRWTRCGFTSTNAKCLGTGMQQRWPNLWCWASPRRRCPQSPSSRPLPSGNDKVLTESALIGKKDYLYGLKEKRHRRQGWSMRTGFRAYIENDIVVPVQPESPDKFLEDLE
jgi:DNA-directed RNA polymerase subunit beta'